MGCTQYELSGQETGEALKESRYIIKEQETWEMIDSVATTEREELSKLKDQAGLALKNVPTMAINF